MVTGAWAAGKTSLALLPLVHVSKALHRAAIVDVGGYVFPPVLAQMGAALGHVLFVRPEPHRAIWAAEQILRSGIFCGVLLVDSIVERRRGGVKWSAAGLRRLQLASELTDAAMLVVRAERTHAASASLCLQVDPNPEPAPGREGFMAMRRKAKVSVFRGARSDSTVVEL